MRIDVIDDFESFSRLRENWDALYEADPEAQFFLSWTWLSHWLPTLRHSWFVLAAKPSDACAYVAFFPLRHRIRHSEEAGFHNDINMAGNHAADYTGFLCRPESQHRAIPALARCLNGLNWTRMHLENIRMSDERLRLFLAHFPERTFRIATIERINKEDGVNNCICPRVALPADWDHYLDGLSANARQRIRRFVRMVESDGGYRITHADADTIERDVEILLGFWKSRWGLRKRDRLNAILETVRTMLPRCFGSGCLFLPVLWRDDKPLGALASLVDAQKGALLFYVGGRDESVDNPPPGLVLHAHSIRYAIANGFGTYDFLRGNERYKYSLGAEERRIRCVVVGTRTGRNLGDKLHRRSVPAVLRRTTELHRAGRLAEAERGYRQVLDVAPRHPDALYCLGQLMATEGRHGVAATLFATLVALKPEHAKAWLRLAESLYAGERFSEAADACREAIRREPNSPLHGGLRNALLQCGALNGLVSRVSAPGEQGRQAGTEMQR
jgi:CelD/BcsL family acetyltransferase involved in cellulose biosynthesis